MMTGLFLGFLGVYYLNGLVLALLPDSRSDFQQPLALPWVAAGLVLLLAAARAWLALPVPAPAVAYLHMLGFFTTLAVVGSVPAAAAGRGLRRWRALLPLLSATAALLLVAALAPADRRDWPQALLLIAGLVPAVFAARGILAALGERIELAAVPPALRGAPIRLLACAGMALAAMGFAGALPW